MILKTKECKINQDLSITPNDIDVREHFVGAFGRCESETSANFLVRFAQYRNEGWLPFTKNDIEKFYNGEGHIDFEFNTLIPYYIKKKKGIYYFTTYFVENCYKSSPMRN